MNSELKSKPPILQYFFSTGLIVFLLSAFMSLSTEAFENLDKIGSVRISRCILLVIITAIGVDFIRKRQKWIHAPVWKLFGYTCLVVALTVIIGFLTSFEGPQISRNKNLVFETNKPGTPAYQRELLKIFARVGTENLYYMFEGYRAVDGRHFLITRAIGKDFVAEFPIDITDSGNGAIKNLIRVQGKSYGKVEMQGLKFDLDQHVEGGRFVFRDLERFAD